MDGNAFTGIDRKNIPPSLCRATHLPQTLNAHGGGRSSRMGSLPNPTHHKPLARTAEDASSRLAFAPTPNPKCARRRLQALS
eukprot:1177909-Prorocentrum_minimum.AAC.3